MEPADDAPSVFAWRFEAPGYAQSQEQTAWAATAPDLGPGGREDERFLPLAVNPRVFAIVLMVMSVVFVYLWAVVGTDVGIWWKTPWYAAALVQGVAAGMLLCLAGYSHAARSRWSPPLYATALPFVVPIVYVLLLEVATQEADTRDRPREWTLWTGRVISVLSLVSAGVATGMYWRRSGKNVR
jgi:hypothetical protein